MPRAFTFNALYKHNTVQVAVLVFIMKRITCQLLCVQAAFSAVDTLYGQGTAFTYQGLLCNNGNPANNNFDLAFTVYDSTNLPGNVIAGPVTNSAVGVTNGLFTTVLDFGTGVFTGPGRWLQTAARVTGTTNFTTLSPRQPLTPVPYAIFANTASNLSGLLTSNAFAGYTNTVAFTNGANLFIGTFIGNSSGSFTGNGNGLTNLSVAAIPASMSTNRTFYNIVDWGADPTGGSECSVAISNAMAAMPATGGTLYFPGRFWLTNTINITKPMTLYGDGSASIALNTNAYPSPSEITWSMNANLFVVLATNCAFHGLTLNNINSNPTWGAAIFITNSIWYVRVNCDELTIIGGWNGIDSEVNEHEVYSSSFFENMRNYGILARNNVNNDAGDWRVIGCTFQNHGYTGNAAIHIESSGGVGILGCKFNTGWNNQIEVIPNSGYTGTSICQVEGNSFENYTSHAIYASGSYWPYWTITGNEFAGYESSTYPIYITGGIGSYSIIDDNTFAYISGAAAYLSGESDIIIGNMTIYPSGPARWYDGGGNSQIQDSAIAITTGTMTASNFIGNGAGLTNLNVPSTNVSSNVVIEVLTNAGWSASGCLNRFTNSASITTQPPVSYGPTTDITNFVSATLYNVGGRASNGTLTNLIAGTYDVSFTVDINISSEQKIEVYTNGAAASVGASGFIGSNDSGVGRSITGFGELTVPANTKFSLRVDTASGSAPFDIGSFEIRFVHP